MSERSRVVVASVVVIDGEIFLVHYGALIASCVSTVVMRARDVDAGAKWTIPALTAIPNCCHCGDRLADSGRPVQVMGKAVSK